MATAIFGRANQATSSQFRGRTKARGVIGQWPLPGTGAPEPKIDPANSSVCIAGVVSRPVELTCNSS
jgi:hypothetical protein